MPARRVHLAGAPLLAALALFLVLSQRGRAADVSPVEVFALAADRADGLKLLTPGYAAG